MRPSVRPVLLALAAALTAALAAPALAHDAAGAHLLEFSARPLDTRAGLAGLPVLAGVPRHGEPGLRLVQFAGPVRQAWLDALKARGVQPLQYVRHNGYLVWAADDAAVAALDAVRSHEPWLAFDAPFHPALKLDPLLDRRLVAPRADDDAAIDVVVQIHGHDGDLETRRFVEALAVMPDALRAPLGPGRATAGWSQVLGFRNLELRVRVGDIAAIAARPDVSFVGERLPTQQHDEKQSLIMSGDLLPGTGSGSHLAFLLDRGFPDDAAAYPVVDITDSTIHEGGSGVGATDTQDPMLRAFGEPDGDSRVVYFENCSDQPDATVAAEDGHGTINASIVGGYDTRAGWPYQDDGGQWLGLGVNPFGRVGSTTVFVGPGPGFNVWGCGGSDEGVIAANARNGAAISNNSWGSRATGTYGTRDQLYDAAVRDVDVAEPGNRPMTYVVSAANDGPSAHTVGSPASAKNVITVGASENFRPVDIASQCPDDSLAAASDDPQSVAPFSSRGPVAGERVKPEVIAPGTRITGSRSIHPGFANGGVCIPSFPAGQTTFSASSGTSHSAPAVSGVASLAYWWIENGGGEHAAGTLDVIGGARTPSPALMKAWLMAHPSYLTGTDAGDDLPSNRQGYGMPDMSAMFDATPKVLLDQSERLDAAGEVREYTWGIDDTGAPVRIALAWTDAPGLPGTSPQVNDLDLEVRVGDTVYLGNHFAGEWSLPGGEADDRNNYEAVFLPAGTSGDVTITVRGSNIAGDGVPGTGDGTDQDFALVCINCVRLPTFTMTLDQPDLQACAAGSWTTSLELRSLVGFDDPVVLSLADLPTGIDATFDPNPATAPATAMLHLDATAGVGAGTWPVVLHGESPAASRALELSLSVYDERPAPPLANLPADGSSDVPATPVFAWEAAPGAHTYRVEVATDAAFGDIVRTHETRDTTWAVPADQALATSARYWWRVTARNACGDSGSAGDTVFADGFEGTAGTAASSFTTIVLPGDCPVDAVTTVLFDHDMEDGAAGWSEGAAAGSTRLWSLGGDAAHGGAYAWQASAPASGAGNDAWLVSPPVDLPDDLATPTLKFWSRQSLKAGGAGLCYDGALVEVSSNGGGNWTALAGALTDPFDGTVNGSFGNPMAGTPAWCGDPQAYLASVLDLSAYAGQTVQFRFRIGHDRFPHRPGVNWAIDDVRVAGCAP